MCVFALHDLSAFIVDVERGGFIHTLHESP